MLPATRPPKLPKIGEKLKLWTLFVSFLKSLVELVKMFMK